MSKWDSYYDNRLISDAGHYYVIKPCEKSSSIPLACSVCKFLMISSDDATSYLKFECCSWCADQWAYINAKRWNNGWRPTQDEINSSIANKITKNIMI